MSIPDYIARFSLELVVLSIALIALITNWSLINRTESGEVTDQSVIFSFLKNHPNLNSSLLASSDTTTMLGRIDQLLPRAQAQSSGIALASDTKAAAVSATTIQAGVAIKTNPADTDGFSRLGTTKYTVQSGDTIGAVASSFGISPETVMMENKLNQTSLLKPGQELTILPTTGITYTTKESDTIESITGKYKISEDDFLDANSLESFEDLAVGSSVVIPLSSVALPAPVKKFVKDETNKVALKQAAAPVGLVASAIDFIWPTPVRTITQGFSGRHTGLDISDSKMEPIYAAANGFVEISGYQAGGYGNTIVINHGNGFKTRYAHASTLNISAGDSVAQGQVIAKQGRSGRVRGVTGIHLHFEIMRNGTRVNPLSYVRP